MSNINVEGYLNTVNAPWGKLFYKLLWNNLEFKDKKVLDFGSGFGITANFLAEHNDVLAIEPNEAMLEHRFCSNSYTQLIGGIELLAQIPTHAYDVIVCHNVLEYLDNREALFHEFNRILNPDGIISIVKHNRAGKIMQKAVFDYDIDEALDLLHNGNASSVNFGTINVYENSELEHFCNGAFQIDKAYGIRMFFALQRNELKNDTDWISNMYRLECAAEEVPEFRNIAAFHHIILKKSSI